MTERWTIQVCVCCGATGTHADPCPAFFPGDPVTSGPVEVVSVRAHDKIVAKLKEDALFALSMAFADRAPQGSDWSVRARELWEELYGESERQYPPGSAAAARQAWESKAAREREADEASRRHASIGVDHLASGYWRAVVAIDIPKHDVHYEQSKDRFHDAGDAVQWGRDVVDLFFRNETMA